MNGLGYTALAAAETITYGSGKAEYYIWAETDMSDASNFAIKLTICGRDATDTLGNSGKANWTTMFQIQQNLSKLIYDRGGSTTDVVFEWGSYLQTGETCYWYDVSVQVSPGSYAAADPGTYVQGRPVAGAAVQVYPDILLKPEGGIAVVGDTWTVATAYDGAADYADDPSLSLKWDAGVRTEQVVEVTLAEPVSGPILGILLRDMTVENLKIEVADSTATYIEMVSYGDILIDGMRATRNAGIYVPKSGTGQTTTRQFVENELVGYGLVFDGKIRTVTANGQGVWDPTFSGKKATIRADYSGVSASEATIRLIPNSILVLVNVTDFGIVPAVMVTYQAGTSGAWPDSASWKLGRILVGDVHIFGNDPSWGRNVTTEILTDDNELASGRTRPRAKLPPRRRAEISWQDGVDTTRSFDSETPDYLESGSGGTPIANVGGTPWQIEGILRKINGSESEVVYLPRIPLDDSLVDPGSTLILNRRHQFIHGRTSNSVAIEGVQGEENSTEVVRVNTITITEVV